MECWEGGGEGLLIVQSFLTVADKKERYIRWKDLNGGVYTGNKEKGN